MISQCAFSAHNALTSRHLLPPVHKVTATDLTFWSDPLVFSYIRDRFLHHWSTKTEEEIESGRTLVKRQAIHHSRAFDPIRYDRANSFPKREVNSGEPRKARLIQAQVNEVSAYLWDREYVSVLKAIGDLKNLTFDLDGVECQFVYAGGLNHDDLSDLVSSWLSEPGQFCIDERDGKNWDATMQYETLDAECQLYEALGLECARHVRCRMGKVVGKIIARYGSFRIVMKYITMFKRLSGDWNTTSGNTLVSMMVVAHTLKSLPSHLRPARVKALFMGDDYWAKYSYQKLPDLRDLHQALDHYDAQCGITPERGIFLNPLLTTFISLTLWPRRCGGFQFVPKPAKQLRKLFWSPKLVPLRRRQQIVNGMCICLWPVYEGFEMMQRFLKLHYLPRAGFLPYTHFFGTMFTKTGRDVDWQLGFSQKYSVPFSATRFDFPQRMAVFYQPAIHIMLREEECDPVLRPGSF